MQSRACSARFPRVWRWIEKILCLGCYLVSMRCFLGLGQKVRCRRCSAFPKPAMFSISQTNENTADYKIQTHSERSLGWYETANALKDRLSELSLFPLRLLCQCGCDNQSCDSWRKDGSFPSKHSFHQPSARLGTARGVNGPK